MANSPEIVRSIEELQQKIRKALKHAKKVRAEQATEESPAKQPTLGYVATMGAFHTGHATLLRRAREQNDVVVVSIFVNPLQFGPDEDFDRYPRDLNADVAVAVEAGVDFVFAPSVEEIYPGGKPRITVFSGELGQKFEGKTRPGHFDGALTVINKFFNILAPAAGRCTLNAYFGQKDAQQVSLVQRMVADFNHSVVVKPVAIVRDDNGLALSSRNEYLSEEEREKALVLSRTLALLREQILGRGIESLDLRSARDKINHAENVNLDYLEVVDPTTFEAPTADSTRILALVAAYVGETRLIDNMELI
ncbi:pantoate--beta-alanine ligase [Rothia aerolata]|uniref:Pantothenate synthetase n=1 Tax=Rothia aerolata TaxID=1812262 RepID=A0A917IVF0_9MICC|nr:pantoate--beta-alanine ligase [Rothia aerolata]GGH64241.1 pantothenate synthetase [Rothia aerolata]